jgi:hypothetical protein
VVRNEILLVETNPRLEVLRHMKEDAQQFTESARQIGLYRLHINSRPSKG